MTRSPSSRDVARAKATPSLKTSYGRFETPEDLAGDSRVSPTVRIRLLNDWAQDLTARLQATDENMPGNEPGRAGDLLRRVHVCLERLEPPIPQH